MMKANNNDNDIDTTSDEEMPSTFGKSPSTAMDSTKESDDDVDKTPPSAPPSLTKLLSMVQQEMPMLFLTILLMIGAESTNLITPLIIADAYNALVDPSLDEDERMGDINRNMTLAVVIVAAGSVAGWFGASILGVIGERLVARLRLRLYEAILNQDISFFDEHKSGELTSRLSNDTSLLQMAIAQSIPETMLGFIKIVVCLGLMFWISPKLAGMTIGSIFIVFVFAMPFGKLLGRLSKAYQDKLGEAQVRSTEALGAVRTVQSFAAEHRERKRYAQAIGDPDDFPFWYPTTHKSNPTTYSVGFYKAITEAGFYTFIFGVGFLLMYVSLWYGFYLVNDGEMTLGDLTAFQSYIFTIGFGLGATSSHIAKVLEAMGASGRIFYLLERVPAIPKALEKDQPPPKKPESMEGLVEFENVNFSYPSRADVPVLKNYTLKVPPNTTAALVGSSGAGKSTVVALLQRFYEVNTGSVKVDGIDIRDLDIKWLRQQIGYVQQEPQLMGLSVRENVMYGVDREVSQQELEQVCIDANAHDFISAWPDGYETMVGERGVKLSGGQKQRIAIARALLTNCRILLLDEATSALDAESEHLVQEAIEKVVVGRTVIIIAHRLSTIRRASQIVVMDNHEIVDVGDHETLMKNCDKYKDLIKRQSMIQVAESE
jgi:ABC-type multidrug transport system fused ATPase/permease subunit